MPKNKKAAVIVVVPTTCKLYTAIQTIQKRHVAKIPDSWVPHIKLLYPFIQKAPLEQLWAAAAQRQRFQIRLSHLGFFINKNKRIVCLLPDDESKAELLALRRCIVSAMPDYRWGEDSKEFFP